MRGSAGKYSQWYATRRWRSLRQWQLSTHPICAMCHQEGRTTAAVIVDHVIQHHGNLDLFWDSANLQSLCATHHNAVKQRMEKSGQRIGCDADGFPLDANHHWWGGVGAK